MDIRKNIEIVKYKVAESAEKAVKTEEIRIVAVENISTEILLEAKEGGLREFEKTRFKSLLKK